ncbi:MAG: ribosome hibernation-promoting factor, HPF/YfiA family [Beijerinckiaceae bacterium]
MLQRVSGVLVSGKNLDIGQSLRGQAEERVHDAVAKYFDGGFRSRVTVEKDGTGFRAECTVHLDTGATMHVSGAAHDAYSSVSQVVERIGKQMRRDKRKRTAHSNGVQADAGFDALERNEESDSSAQIDYDAAANEGMDNFARPIVAERVDRLDRISLENAITHLENAKLTSYAFRNMGTDRLNILHERADGSIGWIDVSERQ